MYLPCISKERITKYMNTIFILHFSHVVKITFQCIFKQHISYIPVLFFLKKFAEINVNIHFQSCNVDPDYLRASL